jgi:uncharacterized protein YdiU (UPF0061 family)
MRTFAFDNTYARLPERFYARVSPSAVREPRLVKLNAPLAQFLGADPAELASRGAELLSGNALMDGSEPIAQAYAGHQFGGFVPQLGDGRAILLGEVLAADGARRDIQLKGAGATPFSRRGDGRAALGPVLREYVVSEAMAALGIPTTRALAVVTTGEQVRRERLLPGAVLTRVAASHIRVGTFQYFAARQDEEALAILTRYALARHYPDTANSGSDEDALRLLEQVITAQAALVARWLGIGFVHGVMNTDNFSISGETLDYGPCAFLDEYDPNKTFSSIDSQGRYAFSNQPAIAQWNLARLAETLLPLIADDEEEAVRRAVERLERFQSSFSSSYAAVLRGKLGLAREEEGDEQLAADLLQRLALHEVDYHVFFRQLCAAAADASLDASLASLFGDPQAYLQWAALWRQRLLREDRGEEERARAMRLVNPALIPRNHRIQEAIEAAVQRADFAPFEDLVRALARPYEDQPEFAHLATPPAPEERVQETFCGT